MAVNEKQIDTNYRGGAYFTARLGRSVVSFPNRQLKENLPAASRSQMSLPNEAIPASSGDPIRQESRFEAKNQKRSGPITVLVADDHPVVREGLTSLIGRRPELQVVAEASNGREAVEQFFTQRPDVALLDLRMPIMDGIQAVAAILEKDLEARIIILTTYQDEEDIYHALQAGAQGYLLKSASIDELVECVHAVVEGRTWIPAGVGAKLAKRVAGQALTKREIEVLRAMAAGKSNKEIGVALDISQGTVKVHMTHILEKLKATGRTEAIGVAVKRGLVRLDSNPAA